MKESSFRPQVLVTGRHWLGASGALSIGSAVLEMISEAKQEIIIVAYRITVTVDEFLSTLEAALGRGCIVRIIMNHGEENFVEDEYFGKLQKNYENLSIWDFNEIPGNHVALHAKMIVVDRRIAVVGSANFSRNGLVNNHEIAIKIVGPEVNEICSACEKLIENGRREGVLTKRDLNEKE